MILLMVPMVLLERWGGGQAFWQKKIEEAGNFNWLLQSTHAWPQMERFVLLSPHGGSVKWPQT